MYQIIAWGKLKFAHTLQQYENIQKKSKMK